MSHNLVTSHSLLQDALEQLVPEESLSNAQSHFNQIEIVKNLLESKKQNFAESVLLITKRVIDLQAQIEGFKILSGTNKLDMGNHNIKKVLRNILYSFNDDFNRNNIELRWHIDFDLAEKYPLKIDYKKLNVALHHFFNNATKYTRPNSYIDITYDPINRILSFGMMSVKIEPNEVKDIFTLRFRGKNASKIQSGDGVGMYMVKKALDLLKANIEVEPNYSKHEEGINGVKYTFNSFIIKFS